MSEAAVTVTMSAAVAAASTVIEKMVLVRMAAVFEVGVVGEYRDACLKRRWRMVRII